MVLGRKGGGQNAGGNCLPCNAALPSHTTAAPLPTGLACQSQSRAIQPAEYPARPPSSLWELHLADHRAIGGQQREVSIARRQLEAGVQWTRGAVAVLARGKHLRGAKPGRWELRRVGWPGGPSEFSAKQQSSSPAAFDQQPTSRPPCPQRLAPAAPTSRYWPGAMLTPEGKAQLSNLSCLSVSR